MPNVSSPSEATATVSRDDQFQATRLRLTGVFIVLYLAILLVSGAVTHTVFSNRLERRALAERPAGRFIEQTRRDLVSALLLTNGILLVAAVGISYVLAGVTLRPIQTAYHKQRQFLSDASHELRTPLAILRTDLENELVEKNADPKRVTSAQSHLEEVMRMGNLVQDLMFISRLDTPDQAAPARETINLATLAETAVERLRGYATAHQITLTVAVAPDRTLLVRANREHILQALSNLIKNGIEYNQAGGTVTVSLTPEKNMGMITVADTGSGIPPTDLPKVFDRFYRAEKSRSRSSRHGQGQVGGSGLGLSIVQSIAHRYGGSITITSPATGGASTPNYGTIAQLALPLAPS